MVKKNQKGRPALEAGKRTVMVNARFTQEEYQTLVTLEKTLGLSRTEIIRKRVLDDAPQRVVNAREMIRLLDGIGAELGRSGNNINQLAHYANILQLKSALSPVVVERFNMLFSGYISNQQALEIALRKIIRYLGK